MFILINVIMFAFLWRVRGGLRFHDKKLPANKIWIAVWFALVTANFGEQYLVNFIACYASYQLFGWGLYVGRLLTGAKIDPALDRECELIDDLLLPLHITIKGQKYYLYQFPKLFGFFGTCLTGLIITFLWGLAMSSMLVMLSGLGMGVCYWLGGQLEKWKPLGKSGWNWGEWIFGMYEGLIVALELI